MLVTDVDCTSLQSGSLLNSLANIASHRFHLSYSVNVETNVSAFIQNRLYFNVWKDIIIKTYYLDVIIIEKYNY